MFEVIITFEIWFYLVQEIVLPDLWELNNDFRLDLFHFYCKMARGR